MQSSTSRWFWGIFISLLIIAIIFTGVSFLFMAKLVSEKGRYYETTGSGSGKIAVVDLDFTIFTSEPIVRQFKKFGNDKSIKAIILHVNSPGGGVAASQEMYEAVKKVRDSGKPVIVSVASLGASGAYYTACGSNLIVANPGSLVGSIGVIMNLMNFRELADKLGISETIIKSGELKDAGNPLKELSDKDREYFQEIVDNSYQQFLRVVSESRKIEMEKLKEYANGRVFTGLQAKEIGLIDSIGTFEDAVRIAGNIAGIEGEPSLVREKERRNLFERVIDSYSDNNLKSLKEDFKNEFIDQPILQYRFVY